MRALRVFLIFTVIGFYGLVSLSQDKPPQWPLFRKHVIDRGANESAAVMDVNQDGRLDIVSGEYWFAAPDWKKHRLREISFRNGYIDDFSNHALDVNADSYPDIIACSWFSKKLAWYENPRRFDGDQADRPWKEHIIESQFNYELVLLVDLDGDGKAQEILPNYGNSSEVAWFERSKPVSSGNWVRHSIGRVPGVKGLHGIGAGDVNGDKRPDVITAFGWFEAPADPRANNWAFHPEFRLAIPTAQASPIYVQDVNGDGRPDIIYGSAHGYGLFWLENKGNGRWDSHTIDDSWSQAHAVTLVDLNQDGIPDIVTGKRYLAHDTDPGAYEPLGLYWYRMAPGGRYIKHVIDYGTHTGGGMQIPVVDIDGDGDLDIIVPGKSGLFLFEQISPARQKAH